MYRSADLLDRFPVGNDLGLIDPDGHRERTVAVDPGRNADTDATDPVDLAFHIRGNGQDPVFVAKDGFYERRNGLARAVYGRPLVFDDLLTAGFYGLDEILTGRCANAGRLEILIPPIVVADQSGTMLSPCSPIIRVWTSLTCTLK